VSNLINVVAGMASPWGYVVVGLLAMLESAAFVGLVIPGETGLLVGGFLAYQGKASVLVMMAVAALGAIVGDSIGYEIGRAVGPSLKASRLGQKIGAERWQRAEQYVNRKGGAAVFVGRFVGVLRALVPTIAGLSGMRYRTFLAWNAAGKIIWGPLFVSLGYLAGSSFRRIERIAGGAGLALLGVVGVAAVVAVLRRRSQRERRWSSLHR
jgi:membrane protein DedA with SNARE-associated domain